jgi:hypothetical protein
VLPRVSSYRFFKPIDRARWLFLESFLTTFGASLRQLEEQQKIFGALKNYHYPRYIEYYR